MHGVFTSTLFVLIALGAPPTQAEPLKCEDRLTIMPQIRAPLRGVEPAQALEFRVKDFHYRITFALRQPSSRVSPAAIQIFPSAHRDRGMEALVEGLIRSNFSSLIEDMDFGTFRRLTTGAVERADFESKVRQIHLVLQRRFTSTARIFPSIAPAVRRVQAEVADAARMMGSFLVRRKVVDSIDQADRLLSRAHARLIKEMPEKELRFFDYGIFDEVLSYERDLKMREIANSLADIVAREDLAYESIHAAIRERFARIATEIGKRQSDRSRPLVEQIQSFINLFVQLAPELTEAGIFYSTPGLAQFKDLSARLQFSIDDPTEVLRTLAALQLKRPERPQEWWESRFRIMDLFYYAYRLKTNLEFLETQIELEKSNEPTSVSGENALMFARHRVVAPSDGGEDQGFSFLNLDTDLPNSFTFQPRRSTSGNGNRKLLFDYDTPEFD